jgi:hypothetical protein
MASNLNSEFNYRYQVIGSTPWEKLKLYKASWSVENVQQYLKKFLHLNIRQK